MVKQKDHMRKYVHIRMQRETAASSMKYIIYLCKENKQTEEKHEEKHLKWKVRAYVRMQ